MSSLEIYLAAFLVLSVLINIGLVLYTKTAIVKLVTVSEEIGDLQDMINAFLDHITAVYEMEIFYGDETLQSLLDHARDFSLQMDSFEYIYSLTDSDDGEDENKEVEIDYDNEKENAPNTQ